MLEQPPEQPPPPLLPMVRPGRGRWGRAYGWASTCAVGFLLGAELLLFRETYRDGPFWVVVGLFVLCLVYLPFQRRVSALVWPLLALTLPAWVATLYLGYHMIAALVLEATARPVPSEWYVREPTEAESSRYLYMMQLLVETPDLVEPVVELLSQGMEAPPADNALEDDVCFANAPGVLDAELREIEALVAAGQRNEAARRLDRWLVACRNLLNPFYARAGSFFQSPIEPFRVDRVMELLLSLDSERHGLQGREKEVLRGLYAIREQYNETSVQLTVWTALLEAGDSLDADYSYTHRPGLFVRWVFESGQRWPVFGSSPLEPRAAEIANGLDTRLSGWPFLLPRTTLDTAVGYLRPYVEALNVPYPQRVPVRQVEVKGNYLLPNPMGREILDNEISSLGEELREAHETRLDLDNIIAKFETQAGLPPK